MAEKMTANEQFANHTRSASFALTLSAPQIEYLLARAKTEELMAKYPWYVGCQEINFGDPSGVEASIFHTTGTIRALARRGLVTVQAKPLPTTDYEIVQVTEAGRLVTLLLAEAGFEVSPRSVRPVYPHPDDRHPIRASEDGHDLVFERSERDRRDPADAVFLSMPWHGERVPS